MLQQKVIIDSFDNGMNFDKTLNVQGTFQYLEGVDIKSEPGILKNGKKISSSFADTTENVYKAIRLKEMTCFPNNTSTYGNILFYPVPFSNSVPGGGIVTLVRGFSFYNSTNIQFATTFSGSDGYLRPIFSDLVRVNNNYILTPKGYGSIAIWFVYSDIYGALTVETGSNIAEFDISSIPNTGKRMNISSSTGGFLAIQGFDGVFRTFAVTSYVETVPGVKGTFTLAVPYNDGHAGIQTGKKFTYADEQNVADMFPDTLGVEFANKTKIYRPITVFTGQVYIADGNLVYDLDDGLSVFNKDFPLNVGSNMTVASLINNGDSILMVAHENVEDDFLNMTNGNNNKSCIIKWDGSPGNVDIGTSKIDSKTELGPHIYTVGVDGGSVYVVRAAPDAFGGMGDIELCYYDGLTINPEKKIRLIYAIGETTEIGPNAIEFRGGEILIGVGGTCTGRGVWSIKRFDNDPYALTKFQTIDGVTGLAIEEENNKEEVIVMTSNGITKISSEFSDYAIVQTQLIELPNTEITDVVAGVRFFFNKVPPVGSKVICFYRLEEDTSFTNFGEINKDNYKNVKFGINKRCKKLELIFHIYPSTDGLTSMEIERIIIY